MKKIINGKLYNTETAKEVLQYNSGAKDSGQYIETLYRKKTGEFFLQGEGDAASKYSESAGLNCRMAGSKIIPLTDKEVKQYLENIDEPEIYMQYFEVEE